MFGLIATLVFTAAGCASVAVIATSVRGAFPALRRLSAERQTLADDRVYLITLIETPRHAGAPAPLAVASPVKGGMVPVRAFMIKAARRRIPGLAGPLRAAA